MDVLNRIKELMNERNWTMYKLSKKSGVPQSTLTNIFKRTNLPTIPVLEEICKGFGISLSMFFSEKGDLVYLKEEEMEFIEHWNTLRDEQKKIILLLIKNMNK